MENKVQEFLNDNFGEVRASLEGNSILFVASDIAKVMGYSTTQKITDKVDDEDKGYRTWVTHGGNQEVIVINEGGLYQVISSITKKDKDRYSKSRDFKRWITNEVLPMIRNTGGYVEDMREEEFVENYFPSFSDEVKLSMVQDLLKSNKKLKDKWGKFLDSNGTYNFTEVSKLISTMSTEEGSEIRISVIKLTDFLRGEGILNKTKSKHGFNNLPNKEYEDKFNVISVATKGSFNTTQTRVKAKGVEFIYDLVKEKIGC